MPNTFLLELLEQSTSPWHASLLIQKQLGQSLQISKPYNYISELPSQPPTKGLIVTGEGDAIIAWSLPKKRDSRVKIWASHIDSPTLKLKPNGYRSEKGSHIFALEPYGSPILSSWMNHPLFLSGQVLVREKDKVTRHLVSLKDCLFTLEPAAIHLQRDRKEEKINPQKELKALVAPSESPESPLITSIASALSLGQYSLLAHDLFATPLYPLQTLYQGKYLLSARVDNLVSAAAMAEEISLRDEENIIGIWTNHEEIGSNTASGACSGWIEKVVTSLLDQHNLTAPVIYSIDGAHGLHPSYSDLSEPDHAPILGKGPVIKHNTQGRYRRDFQALERFLSENKDSSRESNKESQGEAFQEFSMRSDMPCGSTVGPILSASLGISCLDMGIAQLGMHAMREVFSLNDYQKLKKSI